MSTTATPAAEKALARRRREQTDAAERARSEAASRYQLEETVLDEVAAEHNGRIEAGTLCLSVGQHLILSEICRREFGDASIHRIVRLIAQHRSTCHLREQFGDPATLERAQGNAAEARRQELETRATIDEVEAASTGDNDETPALARQIAKLQTRLDQLTAQRKAAEAEVGRIKWARDELRRRAPQWLKDSVAREVLAAQNVSPDFHEFRRLKQQVRGLEKFMSWFDRQTQEGHRISERDDLAVAYARAYVPAAVTRPDKNRPWVEHVDVAALRAFRFQEAPKLLADLQGRKAEAGHRWLTQKREIERPIERFVESGVVD